MMTNKFLRKVFERMLSATLISKSAIMLLLVMMLTTMTAWAQTSITTTTPSQDGDGNYLIGNAAELYGFAEIVNNGNTSANAKLTTDIVVNENVLDANGDANTGDFVQWTPIGYDANKTYSGTFDGQGHTISGLFVSGSGWYVGLVGRVGGTAVVKNVGIVDSYFSSSNNMLGSIVGGVSDGSSVTLANVYSTSTVKGDNWIGGLVGGYGFGSVTIINSYFAGKTSAGWSYGSHHDDIVSGDFDMSVSGTLIVVNTFVLGTSNHGTSATATQLTDGTVAAALHYYQDALADGSMWGISDGKTDFSGTLDGVSVTTADVTLHTFDGDATTYSSKYIVGNTTPLPVNVVRDGYRFFGWYDNADLKGDAVTKISSSATGEKEYWAKFEKSHSVSFVLNGGSIFKGEIDHYIEGETTALPTFVLKNGASFEGWYTTEDFTGDRYYFIPSTATEDMTFYAKWGAAKTVFYLNQDSPEPVNVLYEGENVVYLDKTTMDGYYVSDEGGNSWGGFSGSINVPYTGGESTFGNGGRAFNVSQSGFYVFTLTDKGGGNWFISVLYPLENYCTVSDIPDQTYTGSAICPEISVTDGETTLTLGTDYTIEYSDNTNVGTATVTVTGIGNYAGTIEKTFTIVEATPAVTAPTAIENIVYSGEPQPLVTAGSTDFGTLLYSLEENGNYAADIPTATAAGDYTVYYKVEGSANWNEVAAQTVNVTIAPGPYTVTFNANGGESTMEPMQLTYDGEWTALPANTFTRTGYGFNGWNTEADGTGTPYRDEEWVRNLTTEASIVLYAQWGEDIAGCTATVPDQTMGTYSYIYYKFEAANSDAALAAEMGVVVKDGDDVLTLGTDYEFGNVTFADGSEGMPANVGDECLLEIKGKGNYAGSLWAPFTITVADANGTWGDLAWTFHAGTLNVSGTGAMDAASDYSGYPWFSMASNIKAITIGEGITTIAEAAFCGTPQVNYYSHVATVSLPTTLTAIGDDAFAYCTGLTVAVPLGVTISSSAFYQVGRVVGTLLNAVDNADIISIMAAAKSADVTLSDRTLYKDGSWNTLCLPFDVDLTTTDCPLYGATARTVTEASISGTSLYLTFSDPVTTIEAGIPYIIKWDAAAENIVNPVFEGVTVSTDKHDYDTDEESVTTDERVRFVGTYKSTALDSEDTSILFMGAANTLYFPIMGAVIGAQRAYFKIGGDDQALLARRLTSFRIDFGDGDNATGIISVSSEARGNADGWYSLDGRKLVGKPTQNGIYINNGKKVVIK